MTFVGGSTLARSADEIAGDERTHITPLRTMLSGLGIMPVAKPAINLNALGTGFGGGAAPMIQNTTIVGAAARILAAEVHHTGNLRLHAAL